MSNQPIYSLSELIKLRSAPEITPDQGVMLLEELKIEMSKTEWFTLGIMATSTEEALYVEREIEKTFNWAPMNLKERPKEEGPIFLKANQKSGEIHIRIEYGLGEGVLITGHYFDQSQTGPTWGPLPFNLFIS